MHGAQRRSGDDTMDAQTSERLSTRLRLARHGHGMTLKALAIAAGCSESLLSKIENGKAYPSLPMLDRLAQALAVRIGWLFETDGPAEPVISRAEARVETAPDPADPAIAVEVVVPDLGAGGRLTCAIVHVEAGAASRDARGCGGEETGYLLAGQLELVIGGRTHRLKAGDAFAFRSDQPHSFRNIGDRRASVLCVNAPGT